MDIGLFKSTLSLIQQSAQSDGIRVFVHSLQDTDFFDFILPPSKDCQHEKICHIPKCHTTILTLYSIQ